VDWAKRIKATKNSSELECIVNRYLHSIGQSEECFGESYDETACRLKDGIMELAEKKWWEFDD